MIWKYIIYFTIEAEVSTAGPIEVNNKGTVII